MGAGGVAVGLVGTIRKQKQMKSATAFGIVPYGGGASRKMGSQEQLPKAP